MGGDEPAKLGMVNPSPRRPEHGYQKALGMAGRDIDYQVFCPPVDNCLQMLANGIE